MGKKGLSAKKAAHSSLLIADRKERAMSHEL
jgi:hypothetical protein